MISQTILSFCTWVINIVLGLILIYRDISTDRFIGFLVLFLGIVKFNESLLFGNINEEFVAWLTLISFVLTAFVLLYNSNIFCMSLRTFMVMGIIMAFILYIYNYILNANETYLSLRDTTEKGLVSWLEINNKGKGRPMLGVWLFPMSLIVLVAFLYNLYSRKNDSLMLSQVTGSILLFGFMMFVAYSTCYRLSIFGSFLPSLGIILGTFALIYNQYSL